MNSAVSTGVAAVLLAAGGGTRFAGPVHKLAAPLGDMTVVGRAGASLAAAGFAAAAVVYGAVDVAAHLPPGLTLLHNPRWADGQASSLAVGVAWARRLGASAVVVGLGDQPGVGPAAWQAVAAASGVPIAVATYGGRRGHPVRLDAAVWDLLPTAGDRGAGVVMARSPELVGEVACDGDPSDVDTVEDLSRWR